MIWRPYVFEMSLQGRPSCEFFEYGVQVHPIQIRLLVLRSCGCDELVCPMKLERERFCGCDELVVLLGD